MASFWQVAAPYRNTEIGQTVGSLDSVFALQGTYITSSPLSCVIRVAIGDQAFFVKTYTRGGKNLKRWLGRSRARAEWENLLYFGRLGIPTPPLVAYGQEMLFGIFRRGALVTQEVAHTHDLARLCANRHPRLDQRSWVLDISRQLADDTRRLHRNGFGHRDLKLRNILVTLGERPRIYFIDCPAGRHRRGPMAELWFIKDLACLNRDALQCTSRTQRLRFFLHYLGRQTLQPRDKKKIARILHFFKNRSRKKTASECPHDAKPRLPFYDGKTLRRAGRHLRPPFLINCEHDGIVSPLTCQDILRHLPGKRLVCRVVGDGHQTAIAKIFLDRRRARRHLHRELQGLRALQSSPLASPDVLYQGRIAQGGTLLLLAEIRNACNLDHYWSGLMVDRLRQQTLWRVIECIAQLHAEGLAQRDIHLGNFLISDQKIWIIDGSAIQIRYWRKPLSRGQSLSNLALFGAQFDPDCTHWISQALALYCRTRKWPSRPELQNKLVAAIRRQRIRRLKYHSRKMMRSCSATIARRRWHHYILCNRRWYRPDCERLLKKPDDYIRRGAILKDGNSSTVARVRYKDQDLVIKRYNLKSPHHFVRRCLRHSRALLSWRNAHVLRQLGIDTPQPLAMVEERWGPLRFRAYYISVFQPGPTLAAYWRHDWKARDPRAETLAPLSALLARLATARISHGDLKATNLIVHGGAITLVDLDGLRIYRRPRSFVRHFRKDGDRLLRNWQQHPTIHGALRRSLQSSGMMGLD